uniref:Lipase n=1 Tax=Pectinophora gossypiella TaxID=13191 RepID=A0A1E1WS39_PECGO
MSLCFVQICLLLIIRGSASFLLLPSIHPEQKNLFEDAQLNFTGLSIKYGHPAEQHQITTEDGYLLTVYHIPGDGCPVLLVHGVIDSSDTFIISGNDSMAITLANAGYDVWLANMRGNKHSRRHIRLNPDTDKEFWNFGVHELGYYDLPSTIDFVLKKTGRKQLMAIGHSQGTAVFYVMGSSRPKYNDKVKVLISLAPICFLNHIRPPVNTVARFGPVINDLLLLAGVEELLNDHAAIKTLLKIICPVIPINRELCAAGYQLVSGWDPKEFDSDFIDVIITHHPTSVSRKNALHLSQIYIAKKFQQFDYGVMGNLKEYKSKTPPEYDLSKVTMHVELFTGKNDKLSTVEDVQLLREKLPNNNYRLIDNKKMNHMDFVWGRNMKEYLYPLVFEVLETNCKELD